MRTHFKQSHANGDAQMSTGEGNIEKKRLRWEKDCDGSKMGP